MALDLVSWDGVSICEALYNCFLSRRNLIKHRSAHSRQCVPELTLSAMDASVCLLVAGLSSSLTVARCSNTDAVCSNGEVLGVPMAAATHHNGFLSKLLVVFVGRPHGGHHPGLESSCLVEHWGFPGIERDD